MTILITGGDKPLGGWPEDLPECLGCGRPFSPDLVGDCDESDYCESCLQNQAEAAYERAQEEPCFRGGEWAAAQAQEADWIRRNLK